MITQQELLEKYSEIILKHGQEYLKYKGVRARMAEGGENIVTITKDGKETQNQASKGDFIVKNDTSAGEEYILKEANFRERYDHVKDDEYLPNRSASVFVLHLTRKNISSFKLTEFEDQLKENDCMDFEAPWGEAQKICLGDYLAFLPGKKEIYRIAKSEFKETYKKV